MESKDGAVGIRLDTPLQERIGAYAAREGMTAGEALSALFTWVWSSRSCSGGD